MLRDSDNLIERFSGVQAKYDRLSFANGRIQLGFEFDAYQDQYASATLAALDEQFAAFFPRRRCLWFPYEL